MEFRLGTFNLENLGIRPGEETPQLLERLPRHREFLRREIQRLDADILAVQEVIDPGLLDGLVRGLELRHRCVSREGSSPLRLAVLSRFPVSVGHPIARSTVLNASDQKTDLDVALSGTFSRPVFQVEVQLPGGRALHLMVLHAKSKIPSFPASRAARNDSRWASFAEVGEGRLLTEVKRLAQAVELRRAVDGLLATAPDALLAVLGDFNDTLGSEAVRIIAGDARAANAPHLVPQELFACELGVPENQRYTQIYRGERQTIDHILVSQGLLGWFREARIHNENLREADNGPPEDAYHVGSDHAPLVVSFRSP